MGSRDDLIDRLKSMMQTGVMLTKLTLPGGEEKTMTTIPGFPLMLLMPSMPLPPGMGMLQAMGMMKGPPPPGIRLSMELPSVSSGRVQEDPQKKAGQANSRVMEEQLKEQELLVQKREEKRAAQLLEHERQQ